LNYVLLYIVIVALLELGHSVDKTTYFMCSGLQPTDYEDLLHDAIALILCQIIGYFFTHALVIDVVCHYE